MLLCIRPQNFTIPQDFYSPLSINVEQSVFDGVRLAGIKRSTSYLMAKAARSRFPVSSCLLFACFSYLFFLRVGTFRPQFQAWISGSWSHTMRPIFPLSFPLLAHHEILSGNRGSLNHRGSINHRIKDHRGSLITEDPWSQRIHKFVTLLHWEIHLQIIVTRGIKVLIIVQKKIKILFNPSKHGNILNKSMQSLGTKNNVEVASRLIYGILKINTTIRC